jgi:hypothetical protein
MKVKSLTLDRAMDFTFWVKMCYILSFLHPIRDTPITDFNAVKLSRRIAEHSILKSFFGTSSKSKTARLDFNIKSLMLLSFYLTLSGTLVKLIYAQVREV